MNRSASRPSNSCRIHGTWLLPALLLLALPRSVHAETWNLDIKYAPGNPSGVVWNANNARPATVQAIADAREFFNPVTHPEYAGATLVLRYPATTVTFADPNPSGADVPVVTAIEVVNFTPGTTGRLIIQGQGSGNTKLVVEGNWRKTALSANAPAGPAPGAGPQRGLFAKNSPRVTFKNFEMTSSHITVTQGSVVSASQGTATIRLHAGYPRPDAQSNAYGPGLMAGFCHPDNAGRFLRRYSTSQTNPILDENANNTQIAFTNVVESSTTPGDFIFTFKNPNYNSSYVPNEVIAIKVKHGVDIYRFENSDSLHLENIRLSGKTRGLFLKCPNAYVGGDSGFRVSRPILGGRTACLSSPEGGPQFSPVVGYDYTGAQKVTGVVVENYNLVGLGDDCIAFFFHSAPVIRNNYLRDGFCRGILLEECDTVPTDEQLLAPPPGLNNVLLRVPILRTP